MNNEPTLPSNEPTSPISPSRMNRLGTTQSMSSMGLKAKLKYTRYVVAHNQMMKHWDLLCGAVLIFISLCTPYEVGFLKPKLNALFWVNRIFDLVFICDMILQIWTFQPTQAETRRYAKHQLADQRASTKKYLRGWFVLDLVSILPFDILGVAFEDSELSKLKIVRSIRLLRLLKLARLVRGLKIFQRLELRMNFSYRKLTLWQLVMIVLMTVHWIACFLGLTSGLQGEVCIEDTYEMAIERMNLIGDCVVTWFSRVDNIKYLAKSEDEHLELYRIALHTSVTIVIHPHHHGPFTGGEYVIFILILCLGGVIWTLVLSRSAAIGLSISRHTTKHHQVMDDLSYIGKHLQLDPDLQRRLRRFFFSTRDDGQRVTWKGLTQLMSAQLRNDVARETNQYWLCMVPFLSSSSANLVADISEHLQMSAFAQGETFGNVLTLYICFRGIAAKESHGDDEMWQCLGQRGAAIQIRKPGTVWGEDHLLLNSWWLLEPTSSVALTFVSVLHLTRDSFVRLVEDNPQDQEHIRWCYVKCAVRRGIIYEARRRLYEEKHDKQLGSTSIEEMHEVYDAYLSGDNKTKLAKNRAKLENALKVAPKANLSLFSNKGQLNFKGSEETNIDNVGKVLLPAMNESPSFGRRSPSRESPAGGRPSLTSPENFPGWPRRLSKTSPENSAGGRRQSFEHQVVETSRPSSDWSWRRGSLTSPENPVNGTRPSLTSPENPAGWRRPSLTSPENPTGGRRPSLASSENSAGGRRSSKPTKATDDVSPEWMEWRLSELSWRLQDLQDEHDRWNEEETRQEQERIQFSETMEAFVVDTTQQMEHLTMQLERLEISMLQENETCRAKEL